MTTCTKEFKIPIKTEWPPVGNNLNFQENAFGKFDQNLPGKYFVPLHDNATIPA
jgi:hypothetical protein